MNRTQTVFITGASSGLGRAAAFHFHQQGWNVVATMRTPTPLDGCFVVPLDVVDPTSVASAVTAALTKFGHIDVVINNAGYGLFSIFESVRDAQVRELFEVNVFGVMNVTRAVLPHFRERKGGVFVNLSSGAGAFVLPTASLYSASKFALEAFSEGLAYEVGAFGVKVKIIEPGGVATAFGERAGAEAAQATAVPGYDAFLAQAGPMFAALQAQANADPSATPEHVAQVIFEAATDGSDQLRYVATDAIRTRVELRRSGGEEQYLAHMRSLLTDPARTLDTPKDPKAVVKDFWASYTRGNLDEAWETYIGEDIALHPPAGVALTRASWLELEKSLLAAFSDVDVQVFQQVAEGDLVASRWSLTGRQTAEFMGVPSRGRTATVTGNFVDRVRDGKIVEHWAEVSLAHFLQTLGA
jgi:NAD(P)-dependent dehydrogenase (short-subunit alcohol dehydrogenase family)/predicted ester cyclase